MAAHTAMRLLLYLDAQGRRKNLFAVPDVLQAVVSFALLNCHCKLVTTAGRTVWSLGLRHSAGIACSLASLPLSARYEAPGPTQCKGSRTQPCLI